MVQNDVRNKISWAMDLAYKIATRKNKLRKNWQNLVTC